MRCGQINAGKVSGSGKPMFARLLEFSYGTEAPMPDLDIISKTKVRLLIEHPHSEFD